jgi:hypothetical protein
VNRNFPKAPHFKFFDINLFIVIRERLLSVLSTDVIVGVVSLREDRSARRGERKHTSRSVILRGAASSA